MSIQPNYSSRRILLPVKRWFIWFTLTLAFFLNLIPFGHAIGFPDWLALALAFWSVREPHRIGMSGAFAVGVLMDVAAASVMGQHALAYVLLVFAAGGLSRRILWFPLAQQALQILPLLLATQLVMVITRMVAGADFPGLGYFLGSFIATLLWYPLTFLLLLPQYQPIEKDDNRPI